MNTKPHFFKSTISQIAVTVLVAGIAATGVNAVVNTQTTVSQAVRALSAEQSLRTVALSDVGKTKLGGQTVAKKSLFVVYNQMGRAGYPMKPYATASQVAKKAANTKKLRKGNAVAGSVYVWGTELGNGAGLIAVAVGDGTIVGVFGNNAIQRIPLASLPKPAGWITVKDLSAL